MYSALALLSRLIRGLVLVAAGTGKLSETNGLYPARVLLGKVWPSLEGVAGDQLSLIAGFEIAVGVALVWGLFSRVHSWISLGLVTLFSLVLAAAWAKDVPLSSCGCFGGLLDDGGATYLSLLTRNGVLLLLLSASVVLGGGLWSLDHVRSSRGLRGSGSILLFGPVLTMFLVLAIAWPNPRSGSEERPGQGLAALDVVVVDADESPVPECRILGVSDDSVSPLGATDLNGRLVRDLPERIEAIHVVPPPGARCIERRDLPLPGVGTPGRRSSATCDLRIHLERR